tara:strand:- start:192 stop:569 length:378 start_codon:yes stop_codon:yes gene_type:complete
MIYFFLPNHPYISESKVHGYGLFAGKNYKKGDIIYDDLFPYREKDSILFNPIAQGKFYKYILEEGKYINHCSINKNTDIQTINYSVFPVIATQDIKKHDEIYMDYDILHKYYPFIAPSLPNYVKC